MSLSKEENKKEQIKLKTYNQNYKEIDGVMYKLCIQCNEWKEAKSGFYKNSKSSNYNSYCKKCTSLNAMKWQTENKEKRLQISRETYKRNPNNRIQKSKDNAKRMRENGTYKEWQRNNKDKIKNYAENRKHKKHSFNENQWNKCKEYFENCCAYCGITEEGAVLKYKNKLHKEHVEHNGSNDLDNCVPACKGCNGSKGTRDMYKWFNSQSYFTQEKYNKILKWINEDYKTVL